MTIDGFDLKNTQISTDDLRLTTHNVVTKDTQTTFDLHATINTPLGVHTLILATLSGQLSQTIEVLPVLPQMVVRPSPLALEVGKTTNIAIGIGSVDVVDHLITVNVANPSILTPSENAFTITAGERFPVVTLNLTALSIGSTVLTFSSEQLGNQNFTVVVGNAFQPPLGSTVNVRSDLLGMVLPSNSPNINEVGPLTASVSVFLTPVMETTRNISQLQTSSLLNIIFGNALTEITPKSIAANTSDTLIVKGYGLTDVTNISIVPPEDITLGALQINAAGTEISVPVNVAANVLFSFRSVHLLTVNSEIKPAYPHLRQLLIGGELPIIESISPVVASRLSRQSLSVTGQNFDNVLSINIIPADGIVVGNRVTVNGDHTQLSVDFSVDEFASLGSRVVTVETSNGVTTQNSLSTNTITIANSIVGEIPVTSLPLGVVVGSDNTNIKTIELFSHVLGVIRGAGVALVQPLQSRTNSTVILTVEGFELSNVTAVNFEPNQGLIVGIPQIAADGQSLTVELVIATDAQTTTRKISIVSASESLTFLDPTFSRFSVLGPKPVVNFISPNFIVAGETATINIHGESFVKVNRIRVEPPEGLVLSVPQVNSDETLITLQVISDAAAQKGARILIVQTDSGESSVALSAGNQLNVVNAEVLAINGSLVSPLVGILKGSANNPVTSDFIIVSDLLGIVIPRQAVTVEQTQYSQPLSVVKGSYINAIEPQALQAGITTPLLISGAGLQNVTAIEFLPSEGLSTPSPLVINQDSTQLSVDVVVSATAEKVIRKVVLHQNNTVTEPLLPVNPDVSVIDIAGGLPTLDSISPVLQVANSQFELLIRGQGLQEVTTVQAYDSHGALEELVLFGTPVITNNGTELRVTVVVKRLVTAGEKAIVLVVPIGQTSTTATSINTLTIDTLTN